MMFENVTTKELEDRIIDSIKFLETEHNTYPSGEAWRKALKNILKGNKIKKLDLKYDDIIYHDDVFFKKEILLYCDNLQEKINEIIDKLEEIK